MNVSLDEALVARIDAARGDLPVDQWIERSCQREVERAEADTAVAAAVEDVRASNEGTRRREAAWNRLDRARVRQSYAAETDGQRALRERLERESVMTPRQLLTWATVAVYLLDHEDVTVATVAKATGFHRNAVRCVLKDMAGAGWLAVREQKESPPGQRKRPLHRYNVTASGRLMLAQMAETSDAPRRARAVRVAKDLDRRAATSTRRRALAWTSVADYLLEREGAATAAVVARATGFNPSTTNEILREMTAAGWLTSSGRPSQFNVTASGRLMLAQAVENGRASRFGSQEDVVVRCSTCDTQLVGIRSGYGYRVEGHP